MRVNYGNFYKSSLGNAKIKTQKFKKFDFI